MCKLIALLVTLMFFGSEAATIKTDKIEDIEIEFAKADSDTLVVLNCNDVLMDWQDDIFRTHNARSLWSLIDNCVREKPGRIKSFDSIYDVKLLDSKSELLNDRWPSLISDLQSRGVKVLLLSTSATGKSGKVQSVEEWRYNKLMELGIDFQRSWSNLNSMRSAHDPYGRGCPMFHKGMLLSTGIPKEHILKWFLSTNPPTNPQHEYKKIIFVDNFSRDVEFVGEIVDKSRTEFVGIEYTYARTKASARPPLNLERAKKQIETLNNTGVWVSDEEMERLETEQLQN